MQDGSCSTLVMKNMQRHSLHFILKNWRTLKIGLHGFLENCARAKKVCKKTSGTCTRMKNMHRECSFLFLKNWRTLKTGLHGFFAELCKAEKGVQKEKRNQRWTELVRECLVPCHKYTEENQNYSQECCFFFFCFFFFFNTCKCHMIRNTKEEGDNNDQQ